MPFVPRYELCAELGCKKPRHLKSTLCIEHSRNTQKRNKNNDHTNSLYHTSQWKSLRAIQLSKSPLCVGCYSRNKIVSATVVDHIFPWMQINSEAFFHNVFQSLCVNCHNYKTQLEKKGVYRRFGMPNIDYTKIDYSIVMQERTFDDL